LSFPLDMNIELIKNSFPKYLEKDIERIYRIFNLKSKFEPNGEFTVNINQEEITIPKRIYVNENQLLKTWLLTKRQKLLVYCFFSRHHSGYVKERCLKKILDSKELFVEPFIFQLLGEYVIEIIELIYNNRESMDKLAMSDFIQENPDFLSLTYQRIISYWDCYYRSSYPKYRRNVKQKGKSIIDYPGLKMLKYLKTTVIK